jgi:hypothetical protein
MKIQSSSVDMTSSMSYVEKYSKMEDLKVWVNNENSRQDKLDISDDGLLELDKISQSEIDEDDLQDQISKADMQKMLALIHMIEKLTGKKIKFRIPEKLEIKDPQNLHLAPMNFKKSSSDVQNWGLIYNKSETYYEKQEMSFNTKAFVKTEDGREINLEFEINMSREYYESSNFQLRMGDALKDPLVINLSGKDIGLSDSKFKIDIDLDSNIDEISLLKEGNAFIALDRNLNGKIDDGSELFGPTSGDGFKELALLDSDSNNWIDENDMIFNDMKIWLKDDSGNDRLISFSEAGIGAIFVGSINTGYSFKNNSNELLGKMQKSGFYLNENGTSGTIHKIDFAL